MKALLIACAIFAAFPTHARDRIPCPAGVTAGMSYHLARGRLISSGYLPVAFPYDRTADTSYHQHLGYIELWGTTQGPAFGSYVWAQGHRRFKVVTKSNEDGPLPVHHCEPAD